MITPMVNGNGNRMSAGPVPSIPSWPAGVDLHGASIPTATIPTLSSLGRFPVPMQQGEGPPEGTFGHGSKILRQN